MKILTTILLYTFLLKSSFAQVNNEDKIVKYLKLLPLDEWSVYGDTLSIFTRDSLITSILNKKVTLEEINAAMKAAANESFGYNEDEIVSSDIIGTSFGSLFDATQTRVITAGDSQLVKTVSWYDNEMSYVSQLVRTVKYFAGLISK